MEKTLSLIGVVYGLLWLLSFWVQSGIYLTSLSGLGVFLLVVVALSVDGLDNENLKVHAMVMKEIEDLKKQRA